MAAHPLPSVLVVDDEPAVVETLSKILEKHGFAVAGAYSGEEALERVRKSAPNWVVCDIVMGGITGIETAVQLYEICPECRVILMSGNVLTSQLLERARSHGRNFEVLAKPFHPTELLTRLTEEP